MLITYIFVLILFPFIKNFYSLRYGNILMNYYENEGCINNFSQVIYPVTEYNELKIINSKWYDYLEYSFDYFSSQIYYYKGDEEEGEDSHSGSFVCTGVCYKRLPDSDILVDFDSVLTNDDYEDYSEKYKAYSCIYNNIIKTATIDIVRYSDKKCKNQLGNEYHFKGDDFCWAINGSYSFRPLYYEDTDDKIYYHAYNSNDCKSQYFDYFALNENFLKCNSKCHVDRTDSEKYYKCTFKANKDQFIKQRNILSLLLIILIINIL